MKKILSLTLAALMVVSALPVAYAAEGENTYDNNYEGQMGTAITLNGSGTEEWTVTVPAKMVPGDTGTVKAEGTWAAHKHLAVLAPGTVTLTYGAQSMDVAITGGSLSLLGSSTAEVSKEVEISVADAERLFGTWTGVLTYNVALGDKGDVNQDGVITAEDAELISQFTNNEVELTEAQQLLADFTCDGKITATDAAQLTRLVNGKPVGIFTPAQSE